MNKTYLGIGVLVVMVVAAGWYFVSLNEPKAAPVVTPEPATTTPATTTTEVATGTTSAPTTSDKIELDLTKLQGKDRLYTEEEGKYENLSEEERRLLEKVKCAHKNIVYLPNLPKEKPSENTYAYCTLGELTDFRLISLKNGIAVTYGYNPKYADPGYLYIYDIQDDTRIQYRDLGGIAFGSDYIVYFSIGHFPSIHWTLELYRPGMSDFVKVPDSEISPDQASLRGLDTYNNKLSITVDENDVVTAKVHAYDCESSETGRPINCVEVKEESRTFDLSNLP
jgi:hypothetical protein